VRRIRLTLQYDGAAYAGWQVQPGLTTVQGTLEAALEPLCGGQVRVTGAGRTDAGVHALGQVAHFDTEATHDDGVWVRALNAHLPRDVVVRQAREVPEAFHARYSAEGKHYRYRVLNRPERCPFRRAYAWFLPMPLDVEAMERAATCLVGSHDFSSFRASGCGAKSPVRRLDRVGVKRVEDEVVFDLEGAGFLKQMVRNIVGTLVEVGRGRKAPPWTAEVLAAKDRRAAGETAAAWGLTLVRVAYPPPFES
jgi:tRNA pseudouridine38-40 synthase